ncbi:chemotaxis-specific protein-glutamate methyltransferase CheB [Sphingosinicella sp. BN140058]|uniref:chemotaxis-specific protein-glutamate methyltransferase CheB n=1 Tax=Sphingosinicella sp. BN140058 TaxID=1892855 RepID=UPI0010126468|nr:chemotaxis-specific protein-glutamate methyltransferase CheB [Sphingosinicella sp. BN140058]QAY75900.1 chemotaxis-specific protein-glutamate methyltransferase CheB [Sphingosinicella sp. BN140058]
MIRLLIVDDSPLMRRLLGSIFEAEGDFVVGMARDGAEAIELLPTFAPDVVTLDINMPRMDGLTCLDRIMIERPCPVVMFSSMTDEGAAETMEALHLGAVDFIPKPEGAVSLAIDTLAPRLVEKVRAAAAARLKPSLRLRDRVRARTGLARWTPPREAPSPVPPRPVPRAVPGGKTAEGLVLVGTSTGGPQALDALLTTLPPDFSWPILVAQHMPASFTGALARRLDTICALPVTEVLAPTQIQSGHIYIARGDADMIVRRQGRGLIAAAAPSDPGHRWHPSVDRLVRSALAAVPADRLVGVLMTGMGNDGAAAMTALRAQGGRTLAEAEESAVVWGMPGELVRAGGADIVAPLDMLGKHLVDTVRSR